MRHIRAIVSISILALGSTLAVTAAGATSTASPSLLATYAPLPRQATITMGVTFTRLRPIQLAQVRVSVAQALATAKHWESFSGEHPRITVRLGDFTDPQIEPSVRNVPAYLVIFDGVNVPNTGPKGGRSNHEHIEVIGAITGRALEGFSYR